MSDVAKIQVTSGTYNIEDSTARQGVAQNAAEIANLKRNGAGMTADVKQALMDVVEHIGSWTDGNAQTYIDNLRAALYPPANLVSISAVYTQSGTVYETASLDSLKSDLVVTALYEDETTSTVTNYTLSGTLTEGTSVVTVTFGGKSTTFSVTVTAVPKYSITNSLTNVTNSNSATQVVQNGSYSATLTADTGYYISSATIIMGGNDVTSLYYSDGSINIGAVTGNVTITAVGQLEPEVGLVYSNSEPIVTDGTNLVDTEFAPGSGAFTIMCEWSNVTFKNGGALFSLYANGSANNPVVAIKMGYPSVTYSAYSNNFGQTLSGIDTTTLRAVVTMASGGKPVWYYKNTSGELVTLTQSNNGGTPSSNIYIGGQITTSDGSTKTGQVVATFNTFKCYNIVCNENKIKGFLEVE